MIDEQLIYRRYRFLSQPFPDRHKQRRIKSVLITVTRITEEELQIGILTYLLYRLLVGQLHQMLDYQCSDNNAGR